MKRPTLIGGLPPERWIGRQLFAVLMHGHRPRTATLTEVHRKTGAVVVNGRRKVIPLGDLSPWWAKNQDLKSEADAIGETIETEIPALAPGGNEILIPGRSRERGFSKNAGEFLDPEDEDDDLPPPEPAPTPRQFTPMPPPPVRPATAPTPVVAAAPAPAHKSNGHAATPAPATAQTKGIAEPMINGTPAQQLRSKKRVLSRPDFFRVCEHIRANVAKYNGASIVAVTKSVNEAFPELDVADSTVGEALALTGIRQKRPAGKVLPERALRIIAAAVVGLYEKLGEPPPGELAALNQRDAD